MQIHDEAQRVMVVEDDPTFLQFWRRLLNELQIDGVELVSDADKAAKMLAASPYTLLISDVILPSRNGFELAELARKHHPEIEVLLTTAYGAKLKHFSLDEHRFHLLHKPYTNLAELKRLVTHLVAGEDVFSDASEDSFSDNEDYPEVTEWKL
ncbi:MAG: response regulator [Deltaproteobacteria bacterium]|nr:response regulator [Deltaproteobacteria bacterium]